MKEILEEKNIRSNFIYNAIFQVLILLLPFITTPYISRTLGADNIGVYSYSTSIVTYFTLIAALGTTTYGQRKIAYSRNDKEKLSYAFWNIFTFRLLMSGLAFFLYIIYIYFFESFNAINTIVSLNIFNVALDISWFFQGVEDFKNVVSKNIIIRITLFFGIFIFIKTSNDTWIYAIIMMTAQILGSLSMWIFLPKQICFVNEVHPFEDIKGIVLVFLPSIATQVYTVLDKSMIGWITNSSYENGCYEQSERIARLALTVVTSIGTVILPRVANLYNNNDLYKAKQYIYKSIRVVWLLSIPIMFGLIAVSSVFIPIFLGPGFDKAIILLCIFSVLVPVVSLAYIIGLSYLVSTGQQNVYTFAVTASAIFNFILNYFLISKIGALGAAISSILAEILGLSIQIVYCIKKDQLEFSGIFGNSLKYFISGIIMFIIVDLLKIVFYEGIFSLFVLIFSGILIYFFCLFILNDDFFISNIKLVSNKIRRIYNRVVKNHNFSR